MARLPDWPTQQVSGASWVDVRVFGAKGDGVTDDWAAITAAIAAVVARAAAAGTQGGTVYFPAGVYKISKAIVLPSYVALKSREGFGFSNRMFSGAQIQPHSSFDDTYLLKTATSAAGCTLEGLEFYLPNSFTVTTGGVNIGGIYWDTCKGGVINNVSVINVYGTALWLHNSPQNRIEHCMLRGFQSRDNGVTNPVLTTKTGGAVHDENGVDNTWFDNELDGGSRYQGLRHANLYHCAVFTRCGSSRWIENVIENGDIGLCLGGSSATNQSQFTANRFEYNTAHGVTTDLAGGVGFGLTFAGNGYNNNGLAQNDTYSHLHLDGGLALSSFTGERFSHGSSFAGVLANKVATNVYDATNGANANTYSNCTTDTNWASVPFFTPFRTLADQARLRDGFPQFKHFTTNPTSGTFMVGDTYDVAAPGAGGSTDRVVTSTGTIGTLGAGSATTVTGSPIITVADSSLVPLYTRVTVPSGLASAQVQSRPSPTTIQVDTNAIGSVTASLNYQAPTIVDKTVLSGSATGINPASTAAGADEAAARTITVTGAALGDRVDATFTVDLAGMELRAWVSAANTVSYIFHNPTGAAIDLASGTVKVWVRKF